MLLGYARVSTRDQDPTRQVDALVAAGVDSDAIYVDHGVSGMKTSRPEWDRLVDHLRPGDTVLVTELSRLGRTVRGLVVLVDDLAKRDVGVRSLTQGIDTTPGRGAVSTLLLAVFAALAEIEREVLVERTLDGLAAARARGRVGGRPRALTDEQIAAARDLAAARRPHAEIARTLGVSRSTVFRALREPEKVSP